MLNELLGMIQGFSIPVPVTLVCACACAYLLGKIPTDFNIGRGYSRDDRDVRGKRLINRLVGELNLLREDLEAHDQSMQQLLAAIKRLECGDDVQINVQAEQTLRSIKKNVTEFQQDFDTIQATTATAVNMLLAEEREGNENRPHDEPAVASAMTS